MTTHIDHRSNDSPASMAHVLAMFMATQSEPDPREVRMIERRCGTLAALLLLAGMSPPRRRALPAHRIAAHAGACSCGF